MKSILLPTDFSNNALHAIEYAVELFKNEPCKFHLMHVHQASNYISDDLMHVPTSESIHKILVDNTKKALADLVNQLNVRNNAMHEFHMIVDYDNFIDAINQACMVNEIDFIAMGMQGKSATEQVLFGSHTIRVIQRLTVPVLVVPEHHHFTIIDKSILLIKDYNNLKNSDLEIFKTLNKIYEFTIDVLDFSLNDDIKNLIATLDKNLKDMPYVLQTINTKDSLKAVEKYVVDKGVKLVVMDSEKHTFFERLFTKHAVEKFAYNMKVPLLVLGQNSN